jgi:murein DD-endopeptidase MepM/ murein hydrolase activator NlpD
MSVKTGDKITKGQVIGLAGETGKQYIPQMSPHLHFGLKDKNRTKINPRPILEGAGLS